MFEHESWQSGPHVGLQALAPLQLMLHEAPQVSVHDWPFWHWSEQFAPAQFEPLKAEVDVDVDMDIGCVTEVAVVSAVDCVVLDDALSALVVPIVDALAPASPFGLQSNV